VRFHQIDKRQLLRIGMCPMEDIYKTNNKTNHTIKRAQKRAVASSWVCAARKRAANTCGETVRFI
jgi:hypothetical protein